MSLEVVVADGRENMCGKHEIRISALRNEEGKKAEFE